MTREYAEWVNSQNIILRIILYILTSFVFAITLLIDVVVFNTMDFWDGKVSAGTYDFQGGDKTYVVKHEFVPGTVPGSQLKKSTIHVFDKDHHQVQEVVLSETPSREIELYVDGKLRTRVQGISDIPVASIFDSSGTKIQERVLLLTPALTPNVAMNRTPALLK